MTATSNPILVALELSNTLWLVGTRFPDAQKCRMHKIKAGDTNALIALLKNLIKRRSSETDTASVVCCFEAGRDGFWIQRFLDANGFSTMVVEPTSILVNRRARRAKTDRLDAEGIIRVLAAYLGGDHEVCRMVRVPSPQEEDAKRVHREREYLVQERVRIENRILALFATQGVRARPSLRSWSRDMAKLKTGDGRDFPPHLAAEIERLRRRLVLTLDLIRELEQHRDSELATASDDATTTKIRALQGIRGIGDNFAAVLVREVLYRPFANRRHLASYVGLAPMPHQSGEMDRDRRIGRAGNSRARRTLIQMAWLWLRYQPDSEISAWFRTRVGDLKGRTRRIAIVAMARKLLIALWRFTEAGEIPAGVTAKSA